MPADGTGPSAFFILADCATALDEVEDCQIKFAVGDMFHLALRQCAGNTDLLDTAVGEVDEVAISDHVGKLQCCVDVDRPFRGPCRS